MKRFEIYFMDLLALILLVGSFFLPYLGNFTGKLAISNDSILLLINCYLIAYLAYIISFMDTKKVILMALPLLIYSIFLIFFMRNFNFSLEKEMINDLKYIVTNLFDLVFVVFIFFLIDLILNRLLGNKLAGAIAIIGLILYLVMQNTNYLPLDF